MIWEYLILLAVLAWAVHYLWRTFYKKKGCSCAGCPAAKKSACSIQGIGDSLQCPEERGEKEGKK